MNKLYFFYMSSIILSVICISCSVEKEKENNGEVEKISIEIIKNFHGSLAYLNSNSVYKKNFDGNNASINLHLLGSSSIPPKWSPDGKKIAYVKQANSEEKEYLEIYNVETDNLTSYFIDYSNKLAIKALSWSPDGTHVALLNFGSSIIYVDLLSNAKTKTQIDTYTPCSTIAWCPQNNKIALSIGGSNWMIPAFDSNSQMELFCETEVIADYMDWNQDGTKLVYSGYHYGDIFWLSYDLADHHQIVSSGLFEKKPVFGIAPCWATNNDQIIYTGSTGIKNLNYIMGLFIAEIHRAYNIDLNLPGSNPDCY